MKIKFLIWVGGLFLFSFAENLLKKIGKAFLDAGLISGDGGAAVYGFIMGVLDLAIFIGAIWIILYWCRKWDLRMAMKSVAASSLSVEEYAMKGLTYDELAYWAMLPDDLLKSEVKKVYKAHRITKEQRILLLNLEVDKLRDVKKAQMNSADENDKNTAKNYTSNGTATEDNLKSFERVLRSMKMAENTIDVIVTMIGDDSQAMNKLVEYIKENPTATEAEVTKAASTILRASCKN